MNVSPVYHGAPAESRTPEEDRTYAALEELGIPFDRVEIGRASCRERV